MEKLSGFSDLRADLWTLSRDKGLRIVSKPLRLCVSPRDGKVHMLASPRYIESKVRFPKLVKYKRYHSIVLPKAGRNFLRSSDHSKGRIVELDFNVGPSRID